MTFLAPIPAIIAAAVTVPALLFFYFLKLRRRPVRVSSTLLWMQATSDLQVNVPFRMIRPSWLLLLQLLILASLLIALARPAVEMDAAATGRAVLLIDRSVSMAARDGQQGQPGETRLDEAKRRAIVIADGLGRSGTLVSVIAYAARAQALTPFTADRAAIREAIRSITPADQPDDLSEALDLVAASALGDRAEAADEALAPARTLVILLSDGGTPAPAGLNLDNADWRFEGVGPEPRGPLSNLGIAAMSCRRDYHDPATVRAFVRIVNAGPEPVATVLTLTVGGQVVERRPLEVPAAGGPSAAELGEASASFEFQNTAGGAAVATLGHSDSLIADNAGAMVLSEPTRPGVLLVTPDEAPGGESPGWLIGDVLAELDLRPFRTVGAAEYEWLAAEGGLSAYALIVFDRVRPARPPASASLSFGAGLPPAEAAAQGQALESAAPLGATRFLSWDRSHPVLRDVSLDSVLIAQSVDVLRAIDLGSDSSTRILTELARGEHGPLIELVEDGGVRRVVVGFELAQSNWPLSVSFAIFLSNAVDFLTMRGESEAGRSFTTTEPVRLRVGAEAAPELTLTGPARLTASTSGTGTVTIGIVELAGLYSVEGSGAGGDRFAAVNLVNQVESAIRTSRELTIAGRTVASAGGTAGPREVWPWFILAAAALLGIEWFLHAFMMKV